MLATSSETAAVDDIQGKISNFFIVTEDGPLKGLKDYSHVMHGLYNELDKDSNSLELSVKGINVTTDLLKFSGDMITFEGAKELAATLAPVFKWGQAAYSIVKMFTGGQLGEIKEKLKQILEELSRVEEAIRNGFEKLIAHDDAIYYRQNISSPTQILFDSLQRNSTVLDKSVQDKFFKSCSDYPPVDVLSKLYVFLKMADNGLMTQLIANKYGYQVYKDWVGMMRADAVKCVVAQLYYDGLVMERDQTASAEDADYLAGKLIEMEKRFFEIDEDRCLRQIECGEAAKLFNAIATEVANKEQANFESGNPSGLMKALQERWLETNGKQAFWFHVFRGRMNFWEYSPRNDGCVRAADYKIYHHENRMVIATNIYGLNHQNNEDYKFPDAPHKYKNNDNINILMIQPVTQEMLDNNMKAVADEQNIPRINGIIDNFFHKKHVVDINWDCLQNLWPRFENEGISKPMVCLYTNQQGGSKSPSQNVPWGVNISHSLYAGRLKFDMMKMMQHPTLDFTKGRRWEMVSILDQHFVTMGFCFIFV